MNPADAISEPFDSLVGLASRRRRFKPSLVLLGTLFGSRVQILR